MKNLILLIAFILLTVNSIAQTQWKVDPHYSLLNFNISHSGISIVNGKFLDYTGGLTTDGAAITNAKVEFKVKIKSINTTVEDRDNHLTSADFLMLKNILQ